MRRSRFGRFLLAFIKQYVTIVGGLTPLTVSGIASVYSPELAARFNGAMWWLFAVFALMALLFAVYRAAQEVAGVPVQRRLSNEAKAELMRDLRGGAVAALDLRHDIAIVIAAGDAESAAFGAELRATLEAAGWNATVVPVRPAPTGDLIEVLVMSGTRPDETGPILEALRVSGYPNRLREMSNGGLPGGGFFNIVVPPLL